MDNNMQLVVFKSGFFATKLGKVTAMVLAPIIALIFMAIFGAVWLTALFIMFIVVVCAAPVLGWFFAENESLRINYGRNK